MNEKPEDRMHPTAPERLTRREMIEQLQSMASQVTAEAPPVVREAAARAAELAAEAARSARPATERLLDATDDAALKFADRSEQFAAELRAMDAPTSGEPGHVNDDDASLAAPENAPDDAAAHGA